MIAFSLIQFLKEKGKLNSTNNLLIHHYVKIFNKPYYKLAEPFIGKQSDVLNKIAIAALYRDEIELAEQYWSDATELNPEHFDTKVNYEMYQWQ